MQSALTPSADSAARDYYAREKYRSRLCLGGVSLGLAVLGCCAALLPGFQSAAGTLGIALICAGLLALLCRRQLRCRGRVDSCLRGAADTSRRTRFSSWSGVRPGFRSSRRSNSSSSVI